MSVFRSSFVYIAVVSILTIPSYLVTSAGIDQAGVITHVDGNVTIRLPEDDETVTANEGDEILEGTLIDASENSFCEIELADGSILYINEESNIVTDKVKINDSKKEIHIDLNFGSLKADVKRLKTESSIFEIQTPVSVAGVRGTSFSVDHEIEDGGGVSVYDGEVEARPIDANGNLGLPQMLKPNMEAVFEKGKLRDLKTQISEMKRTQWEHFKDRKKYVRFMKETNQLKNEKNNIESMLKTVESKEKRLELEKNLNSINDRLNNNITQLKKAKALYQQNIRKYKSSRDKLKQLRGKFIEKQKEILKKRFEEFRGKLKERWNEMTPEQRERIKGKLKEIKDKRNEKIKEQVNKKSRKGMYKPNNSQKVHPRWRRPLR